MNNSKVETEADKTGNKSSNTKVKLDFRPGMPLIPDGTVVNEPININQVYHGSIITGSVEEILEKLKSQ